MLPVLATIGFSSKGVPDVTTTTLGEIPVNSRSGAPEPPTVTLTPGEQLFCVSDSPDTASMQSPK